MRCPACGYPLVVLEIEQIEVDHCLACGGVWLDKGELEMLLAGAKDAERLLSRVAKGKVGSERNVQCPICDDRLDKVTVGEDTPVCLDRCPSGHGLWFDHGELVAVIRKGRFAPDDRIYRLLHEVFGSKQ